MSSKREVTVKIIGAGGIGSWLSQGVARLLSYRAETGSALVLMDGDTYESKNAERQYFTSLGNKAEVLARDLSSTFTDIYVIPWPSWVVHDEFASQVEEEEGAGTKMGVSEVMEENDYIFAVVDNMAARALICDQALKMDNIDVFIGGNDEAYFGTVYHYQRRDGLDVTAHPSHFHSEYIDPQDRNPGELSCEERAAIEGGTQTLATNMAVAAWLLKKANEVIIEENNDATASEIQFDLLVGRAMPYQRVVSPSFTSAGV